MLISFLVPILILILIYAFAIGDPYKVFIELQPSMIALPRFIFYILLFF